MTDKIGLKINMPCKLTTVLTAQVEFEHRTQKLIDIDVPFQ